MESSTIFSCFLIWLFMLFGLSDAGNSEDTNKYIDEIIKFCYLPNITDDGFSNLGPDELHNVKVKDTGLEFDVLLTINSSVNFPMKDFRRHNNCSKRVIINNPGEFDERGYFNCSLYFPKVRIMFDGVIHDERFPDIPLIASMEIQISFPDSRINLYPYIDTFKIGEENISVISNPTVKLLGPGYIVEDVKKVFNLSETIERLIEGTLFAYLSPIVEINRLLEECIHDKPLPFTDTPDLTEVSTVPIPCSNIGENFEDANDYIDQIINCCYLPNITDDGSSDLSSPNEWYNIKISDSGLQFDALITVNSSVIFRMKDLGRQNNCTEKIMFPNHKEMDESGYYNCSLYFPTVEVIFKGEFHDDTFPNIHFTASVDLQVSFPDSRINLYPKADTFQIGEEEVSVISNPTVKLFGPGYIVEDKQKVINLNDTIEKLMNRTLFAYLTPIVKMRNLLEECIADKPLRFSETPGETTSTAETQTTISTSDTKSTTKRVITSTTEELTTTSTPSTTLTPKSTTAKDISTTTEISVAPNSGAKQVKYMENVLKHFKTFIHEKDLDTIGIEPIDQCFREGSGDPLFGVAIRATGKVHGLESMKIGSEGCSDPSPSPHNSQFLFVICTIAFEKIVFDYHVFLKSGRLPEVEFKVRTTSTDAQRPVELSGWWSGGSVFVKFPTDPPMKSSWNFIITEPIDFKDEDQVELLKRALMGYSLSMVAGGKVADTYIHAFRTTITKEPDSLLFSNNR